MVKTEYPVQMRYINKFSMIAYGLFFFGCLHMSWYQGHFSWKRGKLPRLTHNDMRYQKYASAAGWRASTLYGPALEWYPDVYNRLQLKGLKRFLKKHRHV